MTMDLITSAVSLQMSQLSQQANIAMIKVQNDATQQLVDMITENVDSAKATVIGDSRGQNVDVSI